MCLKSKELSQELKGILDEITPNFEGNLKRAFVNEGRYNERRQSKGIELDDVFMSKEGTQIELRKLKLQRVPDFRINDFKLDLHMLTLNVNLNLGTLRVEGEYEANNKSLQKLLPVTHNGKIVVDLHNVTCEGRVGLYVREDSFVVENYDLKYTPSEIAIRVNYFNEKGEKIENQASDNNIDATLGNTFWVQLTDKITSCLHRQLGGVIVEYSFRETLLDEDDTLDEYRLFAHQQALRANRLFDSLLCNAKTYIVEKNARYVSIPAIDVVFKKPLPSEEMGTLTTDAGLLQDLSTLSRENDFSLYEDDNKLTIFGAISLRDFKNNYERYSGEWLKSRMEGSIKATIYRNKILVKITVSKLQDQCLTELESVQVINVGDIDIDISGLGSISWLNDRLGSCVIGQLRNEALPKLESKISEAFQHAIHDADVQSLLADQ